MRRPMLSLTLATAALALQVPPPANKRPPRASLRARGVARVRGGAKPLAAAAAAVAATPASLFNTVFGGLPARVTEPSRCMQCRARAS